MAAQQAYHLRVCDLLTDQTLDILEVEGPSFDDYIGKTGSLSATVPIPTAKLAADAKDCLVPGRTMLHLERGGQTAWAGPLWTRTPAMSQRTGPTLQIGAATLESMLRSHRILYAGGGGTADQLAIARSLVQFGEFGLNADLLIEMDTGQMSGVVRERTYLGHDHRTVGALLDELAAVEGGFEWRIQVYTSAGVRHRALRLGYPILDIQQELTLDVPGPIVAYSLPEDATAMATSWQARGATVNQDASQDSYPLLSPLYFNAGLIDVGWPALHGTSSYPTVEDADTLAEHALGDLNRASLPVMIPSVTYLVRDGVLPPLGSYVRLRITDNWHPAPGLDTRYRIVGYRVSPEERGRPETCELFLEEVL